MDEEKEITTTALANIISAICRQNRTEDELAKILKLSDEETRRRLNGTISFRLDEVELISAWLRIPPFDLLLAPQDPSENDIAAILAMSDEQHASLRHDSQPRLNTRAQASLTVENEENATC